MDNVTELLKKCLSEIALLRKEVAELKTRIDTSHYPAQPEIQPLPHVPVASPSTDHHATSEVRTPVKILAEPQLTPQTKVALFMRLFYGRQDVYAVRWTSSDGTRTGYSPDCANRFVKSKCNFRVTHCNRCPNRLYLPLTEHTITSHLKGEKVIGIYPMMPGNLCRFVALDFDEAEWQTEAKAVIKTARHHNIPVIPEISRSGNGMHLWLFFSSPIPAAKARSVMDRLLSLTIAETENSLSLSSFDRIIPCQDTLPENGLGNLIALPLQPHAKAHGGSVFTDDNLIPVATPWHFLQEVKYASESEVEAFLAGTRQAAATKTKPDDTSPQFLLENEILPWEHCARTKRLTTATEGHPLTIRNEDALYFDRKTLTPGLLSALIRCASFKNPAFYRAQALRQEVWRKRISRFLSWARLFPQWLVLPRGCLSSVETLLKENGIAVSLDDHRTSGQRITPEFTGILRPEQASVLQKALAAEQGIVIAPTGFGKTVFSCALIAKRRCSTLVIVQRKTLLEQWTEALSNFLSLTSEQIGRWDGVKRNRTGLVDVALVQSLARLKGPELKALFSDYGQIIVDECHHCASSTYTDVLLYCHSRYLLGLTATLTREDGLHRAVRYLFGDVLAYQKAGNSYPIQLTVLRFTGNNIPNARELSHAQLLNLLAQNDQRTELLAQKIIGLYTAGRKILVLTSRITQLSKLQTLLSAKCPGFYLLSSDMASGERHQVRSKLEALDSDSPRIILSTGQIAGEGFDHAPLDTLVLALPISGKTVLTQYLGRVLRVMSNKHRVEIIDLVDSGIGLFESQWMKRQAFYRQIKVSFDANRPQEELNFSSDGQRPD